MNRENNSNRFVLYRKYKYKTLAIFSSSAEQFSMTKIDSFRNTFDKKINNAKVKNVSNLFSPDFRNGINTENS